MKKKIAVLVVHGMGTAAPDKKPKTTKPTYSEPLFTAVRNIVGGASFAANVAWRETYYADILDNNQDKFLKSVAGSVSVGMVRKFVVNNLGDPASYRTDRNDPNNTIYDDVHANIDATVGLLEGDVEDGAPLVILAFSLGCYVISNHIWDRKSNPALGMRNMHQVASIITFGCNMPIFNFAYDYSKIFAIPFSGDQLAPKFQLKNWWQNYYGEYDPLGFPLSKAGVDYAELAKTKQLRDIKVNVGAPFPGLDLMAHNNYWWDRNLAAGVAAQLEALIAA